MRIYFGKNCNLPLHQARETFASLTAPQQTMLKQVLSAGLKFHPKYRKFNCEINLSFVSSKEMQNLNKHYRKLDMPTDVLSFPNTGAKPMRGHGNSKPILPLGDIIICVEIAKNQANEYGHSIERELAFLTVHGLLHLIGYDHIDPSEEAAMNEAQQKILTWVGIER